jgi:hypothetical protein
VSLLDPNVSLPLIDPNIHDHFYDQVCGDCGKRRGGHFMGMCQPRGPIAFVPTTTYKTHGGTLYVLSVPSSDNVIRKVVSEAKMKASSRWNDTCARCGKGTYTGFSSVEHDGPCPT